MSIIPKYRVWNLANKKMYQVETLFWYKESITGIEMYDGEHSIYVDFDANMFVLIPSMGIQDKHGQEIYADDIVCNDHGETWVIRYDPHLAQYAYYWHDIEKIGTDQEWHRAYDTLHAFELQERYEIIGNVHEHMALLDQTQEE